MLQKGPYGSQSLKIYYLALSSKFISPYSRAMQLVRISNKILIYEAQKETMGENAWSQINHREYIYIKGIRSEKRACLYIVNSFPS